MRLLHGLQSAGYRKELLNVQLSSLSCLLVVNPGLFSSFVSSHPFFFIDFIQLLKHFRHLTARTMLLCADLLSVLLEDRSFYKQLTPTLGLFSPHGLFLSILRKMLRHPWGEKPLLARRREVLLEGTSSTSTGKEEKQGGGRREKTSSSSSSSSLRENSWAAAAAETGALVTARRGEGDEDRGRRGEEDSQALEGRTTTSASSSASSAGVDKAEQDVDMNPDAPDPTSSEGEGDADARLSSSSGSSMPGGSEGERGEQVKEEKKEDNVMAGDDEKDKAGGGEQGGDQSMGAGEVEGEKKRKEEKMKLLPVRIEYDVLGEDEEEKKLRDWPARVLLQKDAKEEEKYGQEEACFRGSEEEDEEAERRRRIRYGMETLQDEMDRMQTLLHLLAAYASIIAMNNHTIPAFVQPSRWTTHAP